MANIIAAVVFFGAVGALLWWKKRITAPNRATPRLGGGGTDTSFRPERDQNEQ